MGRELALDKEAFLARHWQARPLLIRNAIPNFTPPASAGELAGLALEDAVESRIIERRDQHWQLFHGPFSEADFDRDAPWTLLVQAVDHYLPAVAALRQLVDFIPSWRVDDIMASYASDGGSVGPHYDNYDVFLLQGEGERLWRVGQHCGPDTPLLEHDSLRILAAFDCQQEYLLGPGDMLYLPPGVAHWGIAKGECTTFSIGFRAPRVSDMLSRFVDALLTTQDPDCFYTDPHLEPVTRPGEIRRRDLERVQAQIQAALDQADDRRWFGELVTEPRYDCEPDPDWLEAAKAALAAGGRWHCDPAAKLAWQREEAGVMVFANGNSAMFDAALVPELERLCAGEQLSGPMVDSGLHLLLQFLLANGVLDGEYD